MENATKALLIAGGVLIAVIIISVMTITFQKSGNVSKTYSQTIDQETITEFNANFTKYFGQDLTIHQVVTICNFAKNNNVKKVTCDTRNIYGTNNNPITTNAIEDELKYEKEMSYKKKHVYGIQIEPYDENGYISEISFTSSVVDVGS